MQLMAHTCFNHDSRIVFVNANKDFYLNMPDCFSLLAPLLGNNLSGARKTLNKVTAVELLRTAGLLVDTGARLHRVLPYLLATLKDLSEPAKVKVEALEAVIDLIEATDELSAKTDADLFEKCVWPVLS